MSQGTLSVTNSSVAPPRPLGPLAATKRPRADRAASERKILKKNSSQFLSFSSLCLWRMGRPASRRSSIPTILELMWVNGGLRDASRNPQELPNSPVTIVIHLGSVFSHCEASTAAQGRLGATWRTIRVSAKKCNTSINNPSF